MANDIKVLPFAKKRVAKLEQELKNAQTELKILKGMPAFATQREDYVLSEIEIVNSQLDGKDCSSA